VTRWWTGRAVGFDLETDGKDPEDARIITACATLIEPGARPDVRTWLAQPERDIPAEATAVHGITTEYAREHGKPRGDVVADIVTVLAYANAERPVIIHNAPYDLTVLDREMRRLGIGSLFHDFRFATGSHEMALRVDGQQVATFYVIDTLILDKHVDPYRPSPLDAEGKKLGRNKLINAAPVYGVRLTEADAHAADSDVRASVQMALAIARRCSMRHPDVVALYPGRRKPHEIAANFATLRDIPLPRLHELQVEWAREQAESHAEWARANPGKTDVNPDEISGEWPVRRIKETS
jgi:DNA polymerase III subunit epsilon